jgi:cobalamin biosynthesis protein CobD/CbiB
MGGVTSGQVIAVLRTVCVVLRAFYVALRRNCVVLSLMVVALSLNATCSVKALFCSIKEILNAHRDTKIYAVRTKSLVISRDCAVKVHRMNYEIRAARAVNQNPARN